MQQLNNGYTFKCMTFEHDYYDKGNVLKAPSTLLKEWGYVPLFEDVKLMMERFGKIDGLTPIKFQRSVKLSVKGEHYESCV